MAAFDWITLTTDYGLAARRAGQRPADRRGRRPGRGHRRGPAHRDELVPARRVDDLPRPRHLRAGRGAPGRRPPADRRGPGHRPRFTGTPAGAHRRGRRRLPGGRGADRGPVRQRAARRARPGGVRATRATTFADGQPGRLIVYVDSAGKVALAVNGGRAVVALAVSPGDVLRVAAR